MPPKSKLAAQLAVSDAESPDLKRRGGKASASVKVPAALPLSSPISPAGGGPLFGSQLSSASMTAMSKKALLTEQREAAEAARQEQRCYSVLQAPAHGMTLWNKVFTDGLQRRNHFFQFDVKQSIQRSKKLGKELRRFVEDVERREAQLQEQQERECSRIGAALGKAVAKRWHHAGNAYGKQLRVEYELIKQRKAAKKQEELLKETEALTSQLITWVLERKKAAQERNNKSLAMSQQQQQEQEHRQGGGLETSPPGDEPLPDLEKALSAGQDLFDETKSLALFNTLNGKRPLREYQRTALQWMINLYTNDLNGILADEMGLGKTVQTIALLCYFAEYKQDWGPHLIVVPTTVVLNWQTELMRWAPGLKVITCIGSAQQRAELRKGWTKQGAFDVCVTSYNVFMRDQDAFKRLYWGFLVLDEAHQIKNFASQKWQALYELKTSYRLLLTGTPLQNNVMELWSLFHFLMPSATAFASHEDFEAWYSNPMNEMVSGKAQLNEELVRRLQALIRPFLLRRLKKDVETQLPSKTTKIIKCSLSPRQRMLYDEFLNLRNTRQAIRAGGYQGVLSVILSLRKVCNHPDLFEPRPIESPFVMLRHEPIHLVVPPCALLLHNEEGDGARGDADEGDRPAAFRSAVFAGPSLSFLLGIGDRLECHSATGRASVGLFPAALLGASAMSDSQRRRLHNVLAQIDVKPSSHTSRQQQSSIESAQVPTANGVFPVWASRLFSATPSPVRLGVPLSRQDAVMAGSDYLWHLPVETLRRLVQPFLVSNLLAGDDGCSPWAASLSPPPPRRLRVSEQSLLAWSVGRLMRRHTSSFGIKKSTGEGTSKSGGNSGGRSGRSIVSMHLVCLVQDVNIAAYALAPTLSKVSIVVPRVLTQTNTMVGGGCLHGGTAPQLVAGGGRLPHWRPFKQLGGEDIRAFFASAANASLLVSRSLVAGHDLLCRGRYGHMASELAWVSHNRNLLAFARDAKKQTRQIPAAASDSSSVIPLPFPQRDDAGAFVPPTGAYITHASTVSAASLAAPLWPLTTARCLNFPDKSTLIHDSGKLQTLSTLLPKLRAEKHRCLIFSQFTVMLDTLQRFLAMRGFPCLRIDGATGAVERQDYVERFNRDERITCMILSTRSGGIGLNLVGADTVIFYDSDWNPTIDLQAQDRCHRIGQTRSVTIYRLICDGTIEEQILEKARERERLNSVVIRSGAFHITAWDHHEKATEALRNQMIANRDAAADPEAAAAAIVSSGATSALLTRQDLRSFFKNINDDEVVDESDNPITGIEEDSSAAIEAAMDCVEDEADRTARRAAANEIRETEVADRQDLNLMESVDGIAVVPSATSAAADDATDATAAEPQQTAGPSSLFTREEQLNIRRQRNALLMRLPNVVDRPLVLGFAKLHPAKARATRRALVEEYHDALKSTAAAAAAVADAGASTQ